MKHVMIWLIGLYRRYISPLKRPCCRFTPTCSAYAIEAFSKRGFFVGLILTVWRILRCNPFSKGGYDPVPEKGLRNRAPTKEELAEAALSLEDEDAADSTPENECGNPNECECKEPQKTEGSIKDTHNEGI